MPKLKPKLVWGKFWVGHTPSTKIEYKGKEYSAAEISMFLPNPILRALELGLRAKKIDNVQLFVTKAIETQLKKVGQKIGLKYF